MFDDCHILSYALCNISQDVFDSQAKVFEKFGIPLTQMKFVRSSIHSEMDFWTFFNHCLGEVDKWMASQLGNIIIVDVDCIPLNKECVTEIYLKAIRNGMLVGPAQRCIAMEWTGVEWNESQRLVYAGPAMLDFSSDTYNTLGKPSLLPVGVTDVAGLFTVRAKESGVPVKLLLPTACEELRWKLFGEDAEFGLGTTYDNCLYHGFEARLDPTRFLRKCQEILSLI